MTFRVQRGISCIVFFFFFKQKTAYEIYQCDWSSDVCSSDLTLAIAGGENWHSLVRWCLQRGYHGLENLALIPGDRKSVV